MKRKRCNTCNENLPATDEFFASRYDRKVVQLQGTCKKCHKEYRRKHYILNRQTYINKAIDYKKNIASWFIDFKSTLSCENCGESRHWVLDFHHADPLTKEGEICDFINNQSKQKALREIAKCKVLCSNCHRDLHYQMRQSPNGNGPALPTQHDVGSSPT